MHAYGAANGLDVIEVDPPNATVGIAATGTTFDSVRQALLDLGADDVALHHAGIRLLRIGMPTPLGPETVRTFADGLEEIIVVEDKTAFIETQIREILYGTSRCPADHRKEGRRRVGCSSPPTANSPPAGCWRRCAACSMTDWS